MVDSLCKGTVELRKSLVHVYLLTRSQALEGKNVKDMLLNVGSGGGAAAAAPGGGATAKTDAPEEEKVEEKEEGDLFPLA